MYPPDGKGICTVGKEYIFRRKRVYLLIEKSISFGAKEYIFFDKRVYLYLGWWEGLVFQCAANAIGLCQDACEFKLCAVEETFICEFEFGYDGQGHERQRHVRCGEGAAHFPDLCFEFYVLAAGVLSA